MKRRCVLLVTLVSLAGCGTLVRFPAAGDRAPVQISAQLVRPDGDGPFPAVVLLHGCDGVSSQQTSWAIALKQRGFVALVVDSFGPRGSSEICTSSTRDITVYERIEDAYGALLYLSTLPFVDPTRIGVMGWSHGGQAAVRLLMAQDAYGERIAAGKRFAAGVAFYPGCFLPASYYKFLPGKLLILAGAADQWVPTAYCSSYSEVGAEVHVFPGAHHAFDSSATPSSPTQVRGARVPMGGTSAVVAYHPEAAARAEEIVRRFLADQLVKPRRPQ